MGTGLELLGIPTNGPLWSASALRTHPQEVSVLHARYAAAGARVLTTCTFRTTERAAGPSWRALCETAVALARGAAAPRARVAGSIAPLEDCWHPERSPHNPGPEHAQLAQELARLGCDLLLCETFAHPGEALAAAKAAVATGLPTWVSLTPGYTARLLTPNALAEAAARAVDAGAQAVLVNCCPAVHTLPYVEALARACPGVAVGAYANAGAAEDRCGWSTDENTAAARYLEHARRWVDAGATLIGGCCGTTTATIAALAAALGDPPKPTQ